VRREQALGCLVARVKKGNLASQALFESLGFCKDAKTPDQLTYVLSPKGSKASCRMSE
jgi:RimJ/RimL family protein N-acetyltransferase